MTAPIRPGAPFDGFRLDTDALAAHAGAIAALAERIRVAGIKALPVPPIAYGVVGQVFANDAATGATTAALAVGQLAEANQRAADQLDDDRAAYLAVERDNAARFSGILR